MRRSELCVRETSLSFIKITPHKFLGILSMLRSVRSGKINYTQVLLKFHEYYDPIHELSLSTTNRCIQTQFIVKNSSTQLKYSSTHCNQGRSSWYTSFHHGLHGGVGMVSTLYT
jgi:hypothetical protein